MKLKYKFRRSKKNPQKIYNPKLELYSYAAYLNQRKLLTRNYGNSLSYKSLNSYYEQATKYKGKLTENLIYLLEQRLDVLLYRIRFAQTVRQARQFILHDKVLVNGASITAPNYQLKPGDIVKLKTIEGQSLFAPRFSILKKTPKKKNRFIAGYGRLFKAPERKEIISMRLKQSQRKRMSKRFNKRKQVKTRLPFIFRPLHVEVNYNIATAIFLYSPQKLYFNDQLNFDYIRRGFQKTF